MPQRKTTAIDPEQLIAFIRKTVVGVIMSTGIDGDHIFRFALGLIEQKSYIAVAGVR